MSAPDTCADDRRSSRVRAKIPLIMYAEHDSGTPCDAVLVNAHGGALQARKKIPVGDIVVLRHTDQSKASATCSVRSCVPLGTLKNEWLIGVELDHPGNFWRMEKLITKKMATFGKRCDELVQTVLRRNNSDSDVLESGKKSSHNRRDEF